MARKFNRRDVLKATGAAAVTIYASPIRAAAPPAEAVTPALIAAAKKEGKVVIYSALDGPRVPTQGFAARAATLFKDTVHKSEPHDIAQEELAAPVAFLFAKAEHDDIPKTDLAKCLAAGGP